MMIVIAVSGWKQSGKDLSANFLVNKYGFQRLAFADSLKVNVANQYNIPLKWTYEEEFKEKALDRYPVCPRDAFSRLLVEFMVREFRSQDGLKFDSFRYENDQMIGVNTSGVERPLYHTPRSLCILEGSTKRSVDSSYWVRNAFKTADPHGLYVLSDVRYRSEISIMKESAAPDDTIVTVRINRFESIDSSDPSERDLDSYDFDYYVDNSIIKGVTKESVFEQLAGIVIQVFDWARR